ncbi:hypothetical protein MTO96_043847 [Rhipicephalus appendiculatus]
MKLDIPATDLLDDEITAIGDEFLDDENEGPFDEEFTAWLDTAGDSSDDDTEGPPAEEDPNWPQTTASSAEVENSCELVLEDWDPVRRKKMRVRIEAVDISRFHVLMVGPSGTRYEGGCLHVLLQCPQDYPTQPPRVRLLNPDDGTLYPNLHDCGKVCLESLGTTDTSTWSPAHSISSVLVAIQSLLTEKA